MSELSQKVMEKVGKIYLMRRAGAFALKCVFATAMMYVISTFIFVRAIIDNMMAVIERGNVVLYVTDALSKTDTMVLILSALVIGIGVAAIIDVRKMVAGMYMFAR